MIAVKQILKLTEEAFNLRKGAIATWDRKRRVANARAVAMYLARNLTGLSWHELAYEFKRDHTSVIHNVNKINKILAEENNKGVICPLHAVYDKLMGA